MENEESASGRKCNWKNKVSWILLCVVLFLCLAIVYRLCCKDESTRVLGESVKHERASEDALTESESKLAMTQEKLNNSIDMSAEKTNNVEELEGRLKQREKEKNNEVEELEGRLKQSEKKKR
eukprot:GHVR01057608.1.p1 GENE.GHVR01057608.1~~GHVR01057608.1.p1  ORF type:complete len:123 (-),score=32.43 GHVR01057608.1:799-1167(-)